MKRFKNILCVLEPEHASVTVLERAVELAESNQGRLTVVGVVPHVTVGIGVSDGGPDLVDLQDAIVKIHRQKLEAFIQPVAKRAGVDIKVLVGIPFLQVIHEVLRHDRDLVIKVPEQQDWLERLFGSDDMHLLRKCPCPLWIIKPQAPKPCRVILAAVDVDDGHPLHEMASREALNRQLLEMASSLALAESAELHIIHVWEAPAESAMRNGAFMRARETEVDAYVRQVRRQRSANLESLMRKLEAGIGADALQYISPKVHLIKGEACQEIPALSQQIDADLVVMGTVARTGVSGFIMGNTAEAVLGQIQCSVLAIKPPGFSTPVKIDD
ncbi:Nucleotide-binding universal stress protein, UspA family [Ferrimonas sediminum]|uniref:Nucleotide-binding universal stress protein, UspA family n=1 Tax=Ferrimonas sediminum TaxID=718193 RepID=A0A1G8RHL6_9GAMM|nr:universal stress protein [Ferrimonas sediminum]SDJ16564.1 Nucleotide-binding universal stress protein, UspA family [Ferrimonas sediminum]